MIIQKIEISNFRGIRKGEFSFDESPFILLSAPNGLGKTTLIDAVEWCLTGNIGRLILAYNSRGTNDTERKKATQGILRNKYALPDEDTTVILKIKEKDKEYSIKRSHTKDELDGMSISKEKSKVVIMGSNGKNEKEKWLQQLIGESFYNYHFCDLQKSFSIQSTKRENLLDLFSDFITDYSKQEKVADNLEIFAKDIDKKIDALNNIIKENKTDDLEETLRELESKKDIHPYPQIEIYETECLDLDSLDIASIKRQKDMIFDCGFASVGETLNDIISSKKNVKIIEELKKIEYCIEQKREHIAEAIKEGFAEENNDILNHLSLDITEKQKMTISKDNIWLIGTKIYVYHQPDFSEEFYLEKKKKIEEVENRFKHLEDEIKHLTEGDIVLKTMSALLRYKKELVDYKNESLKKKTSAYCPVCGSITFGGVDDSDILKDAEEYIKKNDDNINIKTDERARIQRQLEEQYRELIERAKKALQAEIRNTKEKLEKLNTLEQETKEFFDKVKKLNELWDQKPDAKDYLLTDFISNCRTEYSSSILLPEEVQKKNKEIENLLLLLKYKRIDGEDEQAILLKIKQNIEAAPDKRSPFSSELLAAKIHALDSRLNNEDYEQKSKKYQEAKAAKKKAENEINELYMLKRRAEERKKDIRDLISQLKNQEYNNVGPNLFKFYKKLSRINTIENVSLIQEKADKKDVLSLTDESGKNIVNILSNGQISVFMLSYFFANILTRGKSEKFKVYFIDDLTSCMDDVNMLAFLDLMKYQLLEQEGTMDQIFFATCDERICELLRYKLTGCRVAYQEITEKDFAESYWN